MHREKTSRKLYAAVDEQVDLYLHPEKQSGKCNGDCEGVNAAKLHLIKQLRESVSGLRDEALVDHSSASKTVHAVVASPTSKSSRSASLIVRFCP
jgi:hypothetical protein